MALNRHIIPRNFSEAGYAFNGLFRTRNLAETVVVDIIPLTVTIFLPLSLYPKIMFGVVICAPLTIAGIAGIGGDSLFEFIFHVMKFNKSKRIAKYNPRPKKETSPDYLTRIKKKSFTDELIEKVQKYIAARKDSDEALSRDIYDPYFKEFFEDDIGVDGIAIPHELKTKAQLRVEKQVRKKYKKEIKAYRKQLERQKIEMEEAEKVRAHQAEKEKKAESVAESEPVTITEVEQGSENGEE